MKPIKPSKLQPRLELFEKLKKDLNDTALGKMTRPKKIVDAEQTNPKRLQFRQNTPQEFHPRRDTSELHRLIVGSVPEVRR